MHDHFTFTFVMQLPGNMPFAAPIVRLSLQKRAELC